MKTLGLALAGLLGLAACSSDPDNAPPVIDSVTGSDEATLQGGNYVVVYEMRFHDADNDPITTIRAYGSKLAEARISVPNQSPLQYALGIPGNAPKGSYDVQISVIDSRGGESAPVAKNVVVK
jgi:hypothetical protein